MSLRGAILGFLSFEPTSGYTLKQRLDGSVRSLWSMTQSQIYRELHALEGEGLVEARTVPGDGPPAARGCCCGELSRATCRYRGRSSARHGGLSAPEERASAPLEESDLSMPFKIARVRAANYIRSQKHRRRRRVPP
ncbi:PadR family transcriptional regulator [Sorangium sp. So ce1099]|uniref:PadR family transcriptional regulator n=1 Tax=Sorangium sp. So ce1099 TaxID=3133331 RepID=UPI003F648EBE